MNHPRSSRPSPVWPIIFGLAGVVLFLAPTPAWAAAPDAALTSGSPLFAETFSWDGFVRYWKNYVNRTDHVVQVVFLVALAALFIITRGKWRK
jgi:hypothetical protein